MTRAPTSFLWLFIGRTRHVQVTYLPEIGREQAEQEGRDHLGADYLGAWPFPQAVEHLSATDAAARAAKFRTTKGGA
ncbi:hypothetical protein [Chitiniphilus eburneus]|uniref:Uncharacterized protein n=1 Tax=Chitiniphilus eburneus TaxID=2571148 RepID=A0A4V5MQT9_9NEIS|nr:hypothetical protein [Chitiniphilus eburneus]TJZ73778.1 hypothetical protein FAZ21_09145 [Chitiniphilus eburneus]